MNSALLTPSGRRCSCLAYVALASSWQAQDSRRGKLRGERRRGSTKRLRGDEVSGVMEMSCSEEVRNKGARPFTTWLELLLLGVMLLLLLLLLLIRTGDRQVPLNNDACRVFLLLRAVWWCGLFLIDVPCATRYEGLGLALVLLLLPWSGYCVCRACSTVLLRVPW